MTAKERTEQVIPSMKAADLIIRYLDGDLPRAEWPDGCDTNLEVVDAFIRDANEAAEHEAADKARADMLETHVDKATAWDQCVKARAEEREACARVAEQTPLRSPVAKQRDKIAAAIRARGEKEGA